MKKSNLEIHAIRELELAGMFDKDADYNGALAKQIVKIVRLFSSQEHSGGSAQITISILEKLLRFKTLTPLTSEKDEWIKIENSKDKLWQSKRNPKFFSINGGKTWYDSNKKLNK